MKTKNEKEWGSFAPSQSSLFLRLLTSAGLGRGAIRKRILMAWRKNHGTVFDVQSRGIKYRLDISDNITDEKILTSSKIYDKEELLALRRVCSDGVFVDIGANIGYYSLYIAAHGASRVVAIEPNPPALHRLRFNIDANRLQEIIGVVPLAIGPGGMQNFYYRSDLGSASLHDDVIAGEPSVREVPTKPLRTILHELHISTIDGLKIDIEGMEDKALIPFFKEGSRELFPRCLIIERGHENLWQTNMYTFLEKTGYSKTRETRGNIIYHLQKRE